MVTAQHLFGAFIYGIVKKCRALKAKSKKLLDRVRWVAGPVLEPRNNCALFCGDGNIYQSFLWNLCPQGGGTHEDNNVEG